MALSARCRRSVLLPVVAGSLLFTALPSYSQTYAYSVVYTPCDSQGCLANPTSLMQAQDGSFYLTDNNGGGSIFSFSPPAAPTPLYSFSCADDVCSNGGSTSELIQGSDGNLYGGTPSQYLEVGSDTLTLGPTIFTLTTGGMLTTLETFCGYDAPDACGYYDSSIFLITLGSGGNIYAIAGNGGAYYGGEVLGLTGAVYYNFCSVGGAACTDGSEPTSLLQASDGNFYGTTLGGGANNGGTVFKLTPEGILTTLYSFCGLDQSGCTQGSSPNSLVEGSDGNFYGTAALGGTNGTSVGVPNGAGTLFKITPTGTFTQLYNFCSQGGTACTDGSEPIGLMVASDGNFYGATEYTGLKYGGTIFRLTPDASFSTLHNFCTQGGTACTDGYYPGVPIQANDGNLYGTVSSGGSNNLGLLFELAATPALPLSVQETLSQTTITLGSFATLTWQANNAFSLTMQQCALFQTSAGTTTPMGLLAGNFSNGIFSGSVVLTPTAPGTYSYVVDCGGVEASAPINLTVNPVGKYSSATTLFATPNPATVGQTVTFTADVSGPSTTPGGTVAFLYDGLTLGTEPVSKGIATFTATTNGLPIGTYNVTASYSGNSVYYGSSSLGTSVNLNKAPTGLVFTTSPGAITPPGACQLTATVSRSMVGAMGMPTGSVSFYYGNLLLGTAKLSPSGVAVFDANSSGIPAGNYTLTATYDGDSSDLPSTSTSTVKVQ